MAQQLKVVDDTRSRFDAVVAAALASPATPPADVAVLRARLALRHWDAAGIAALKRHLDATATAPGGGDAELAALLRDGGASWRTQLERAPAAAPRSAHEAAYDEVERERRREGLRSRAAHREYAQLVSDVRRPELQARPLDTFSSYRQQLSLGMAAFAGLFSAVGIGYYLGRAWYGPNDARVWMVALFSGIALLLVEMTLLVIQLSRGDRIAHGSGAGKSKRQ